ncbi:hypothetical protein Esi_0129_0070 [Ectocarpus siliculosus]|uniref:Uncharacterized protein n=1 Tax=Ectocarpus siliculosus TaxID=2880 RepID=D8LE44_ECTSI|nr:hypothetical protein Esi_0129_0070 [Ectocarpus siliculosus]|eukprot:CBN78561.1 hypothetical protein Esi_0129_0070 [Ectocarpus siliculosus]
MAVGSTVYELSGDGALGSRSLEAVEMSSSDDCSITGVPSTAECYTGDTAMTLDGDVSMTLTICLCYYMDGSKTIFRSQVFAEVVGASTVSVPDDEIEICLEAGFIMQLTTATVEDEDYYYNFDLVVPGRDSSSDLSVSAAPDEDAQAFIFATAAPVLPLPVETPAPSPTEKGLASPAPTSVGVDGGDGGAVVTTVPPTAVATSTGEGEGNNMEGQECMIPEEAPCTSTAATIAHTNQGVGSYYDPTCAAAAATASEEGELPEGCDPSSADSCRFCLFNTPRWQDKNPGEDLPDLVDCPCCVVDVYKEDTAISEDGVRSVAVVLRGRKKIKVR